MIEPFDKLLRLLGLGNDDGGDGAEGISCEEALERLFEYLDGELEGETRERVATHFRVCQRCYPRLSFERSFLEAVRRAQEGKEAPEELKSEVRRILTETGLEPG